MKVGSVQFAKAHSRATIPTRSNENAAGFDLYLLENYTIPVGNIRLLKTGIIAIPPLGFRFDLAIRSSAATKHGIMLANGQGIIDSDYTGPNDQIYIPVYIPKDIFHGQFATLKHIRLRRGDKIAQLILRQDLIADIEEIPYDTLAIRGSRGGFGSSDA